MTNEQLTEIEARLNSATPGPWLKQFQTQVVVFSEFHIPRLIADCGREQYSNEMYEQNAANAALVINAPSDIAALIAEVRKLQAIVARIDRIRRGNQDVGDVFYALEAGEISVGKATECVRAYLTTGITTEYVHAPQEPQ